MRSSLKPHRLKACAIFLFFLLTPAFAGSWQQILSASGYLPVASAPILITPPAGDYRAEVESGTALILEGASPAAEAFGFKPRADAIPVIHVVDEHDPSLPIVWKASVDIPRFDLPPAAHVFAKDRWTGAPLIAGYRLGKGAVLWVAASPGAEGYERFPYIPQALADLGIQPGVRASRLWAFFDYSYRLRADPDYLAAQWRRAGIGALHVASWHFFEPDPGRDAYLIRLIGAAHRHGILVYAWVEFPHVSDQFWTDHPEWREKTGLLQDAQLDWRKLMNLQNPDCAAAARAGLEQMMRRFDWDGINLAELYFESLEGIGNQARFTPMNPDVRREFQSRFSWDPAELWSSHKDGKSVRQFLDFRAELARRMQEQWLSAAEGFRSFRPDLDIVLTHVDDRFDPGMRDAIGADAAQVLPLLDSHAFSFLIEDPATIWNLGPRRYPEIAKRYRALTTHSEKLGIDINAVDRYQDVYPTKQQTGVELFELLHLASAAFPRVALYFEDSIRKPDLPFIAASSAVVNSYAVSEKGVTLDATADLELAWPGGARVDGHAWPMLGGGFVRLPAGKHTIEAAPESNSITVIDLNARLVNATIAPGGATVFEYESASRAIVRFDRKPSALEIDAAPAAADVTVLLPRGRHRVSVRGR